LYALDPLSRTICLRDGKPGGSFQNNEVRNRCSDIDFDSYNPGSFTVAIEGARLGNIIQETVGQGQGFASLRAEGSKIVVLKDRRSGTVQELEDGTSFLKESRKGATAAVRQGHIYLVRLADRQDKEFSLMAKLIVVDYRPSELVTIRWALLQR
jgi:hypothetical protein